MHMRGTGCAGGMARQLSPEQPVHDLTRAAVAVHAEVGPYSKRPRVGTSSHPRCPPPSCSLGQSGDTVRNDVEVVCKLKSLPDLLCYLKFNPDRYKKRTGPPMFDCEKRLPVSLRMFFADPAFARPILVGEPTHEFPRYTGPDGAYYRYCVYFDSVSRLILSAGGNTPAYFFAQTRNVMHGEHRERAVSDKRGTNGLEIKVEGPSRHMPAGDAFSGLSLCWPPRMPSSSTASVPVEGLLVLLVSKRDVPDMYGCVMTPRGRTLTNAIGKDFPAEWFFGFKSFSPSLLYGGRKSPKGAPKSKSEKMVRAHVESLQQGEGDAVEAATAGHRDVLQEDAGVLAKSPLLPPFPSP